MLLRALSLCGRQAATATVAATATATATATAAARTHLMCTSSILQATTTTTSIHNRTGINMRMCTQHNVDRVGCTIRALSTSTHVGSGLPLDLYTWGTDKHGLLGYEPGQLVLFPTQLEALPEEIDSVAFGSNHAVYVGGTYI
jgi:Regulator of chromosome condensation (RCC1) repeat